MFYCKIFLLTVKFPEYLRGQQLQIQGEEGEGFPSLPLFLKNAS